MPEVVNCPQCQRKLRVPDDLLGKQVKCPTCATTFTAMASAAPPPKGEEPRPAARRPAGPPPEEEFEEEPRRSRRPARARDEAESEDDYDEEDYEEDEYEERPRRRGRRRRQEALDMLKAPAICLIVTGVLGLLYDFFSVAHALVAHPGPGDPGEPEIIKRIREGSVGPAAAAFAGLFVLLSLLVIIGAVCMLNGKLRGLAITGSIAAMINLGGCCCLPGLAFGIWSLVVLSRPEVRDAFS